MSQNPFKENIKIALGSIKAQMLRTVITALIIAFGIMALVGILTAIDGIEGSLRGQFALLGANTFTIQNRAPNIRIGKNGTVAKPHQAITYYQAKTFKESFTDENAFVSISYIATGAAEVKHRNQKTNPNIRVWAADENFLQTSGYEIDLGRNFGKSEIEEAAAVAIVGKTIVNDLFPKESPLGKLIEVSGARYRIIGVTAEKGNSFGSGGDKSVFIPISKARGTYGNARGTYALNVMASNAADIDNVVGQATSSMRSVRKLRPKQLNNFEITKSDNLSNSLLENLSFLKITAVIIGAITLFGAAIALMNIMLVSVTERTREIGIRKSIGAKANTIMTQFLTEAVFICFIGGLAGALFGIGIGNIIALVVGGSFFIPWQWIGLAALLCLFVGLLSGFYPAYKASRLDPIESLRYE